MCEILMSRLYLGNNVNVTTSSGVLVAGSVVLTPESTGDNNSGGGGEGRKVARVTLPDNQV